MKKFLSVCVLLTLAASAKAEAFDWTNVINFLSIATSTQQSTQEVANKSATTIAESLTNIQKQAATIDSSVQNEFLTIATLLSAKKDVNGIKSELKSINNDKTKTDLEKSELINQLLLAYVTNLNSEKTTTVSKIKKMTAAQKLELIKEIASLEQYGQKYAALAKQAVTTSATNFLTSSTTEDLATVIANTNQTASMIKEKATTTITIVNQFRTLATLAGVSK